jgi:alkanesulfonate monooxygenase SsuD/methylene tetrahydromethanopterin reductase-like flavin-dependent oxidoreductase (luciferase family)
VRRRAGALPASGHPTCPPLVEHYRTVGTAGGHPADRLRLGRSGHFYVGRTSQGASDDVFPLYKEYVRPKPPTGRGFHIGRAEFEAAAVPFGALMVGSPQEIIDKILAERDVFGIDRYMGQVDFGGMPAGMVHDSIELPPRSPPPSAGNSPHRPDRPQPDQQPIVLLKHPARRQASQDPRHDRHDPDQRSA